MQRQHNNSTSSQQFHNTVCDHLPNLQFSAGHWRYAMGHYYGAIYDNATPEVIAEYKQGVEEAETAIVTRFEKLVTNIRKWRERRSKDGSQRSYKTHCSTLSIRRDTINDVDCVVVTYDSQYGGHETVYIQMSNIKELNVLLNEHVGI